MGIQCKKNYIMLFFIILINMNVVLSLTALISLSLMVTASCTLSYLARIWETGILH